MAVAVVVDVAGGNEQIYVQLTISSSRKASWPRAG
jgi:hypothetical protein